MDIAGSVVHLIQLICVIMVAAFLVTSSRVLRDALASPDLWRKGIIFSPIFGLLAIYATYAGVEVSGAIINVRDLGPLIAGLIAGPVAGIGAGLIGGVHRFMIGGVTALPCAIATILAGVIAGAVYLRYRSRFCGIRIAVACAAIAECLHMLLILALVQPFSQAVTIVSGIALPMIAGNIIGMAAFSFIYAEYLTRSGRE